MSPFPIPLSLHAERFGLRSGVSQSGVGAAALQTGGNEGPRNETKPGNGHMECGARDAAFATRGAFWPAIGSKPKRRRCRRTPNGRRRRPAKREEASERPYGGSQGTAIWSAAPVTPLSLHAERFGLRSGVSQSGVGAAALQMDGDDIRTGIIPAGAASGKKRTGEARRSGSSNITHLCRRCYVHPNLETARGSIEWDGRGSYDYGRNRPMTSGWTWGCEGLT